MAANGVRRALQLSSSPGKIFFGRSSTTSTGSKIGKSVGISFGNESSSSSLPSLRRLTLSRLAPKSSASFLRVPVELSAIISLIPLHSVTASALLTSLLSLSNQNWSCLSEGFASTL